MESVAGDASTWDLVMGASDADVGGSGSGAVYVADGPVTAGGAASGATEVLAGTSSDNCGTDVAGADFDGDGLSDLAVGCYDAYVDTTRSGSVEIVYGPLTTLSLGSSDVSVYGDASTANENFGERLDAGDLDGDGTADLLVGAEAYNDGTSSYGKGRSYVYLGPITSTPTADGTLTGAALNDYLGSAVAVLPDTDGDGNDDIAVGAWANDTRGSQNGSAYVLLGPATGTTTLNNTAATTDAWIRGDDGDEYFGWAVHGGDFDGDGYGDLVVGAPYYDPSEYGAALIFLGPVTGTSKASKADIEITGDTSGYRDGLGYELASGDFDDDGALDLVVGCPAGYNSSAQPGGLAYLFAGPVTASTDASAATARIDSAANGDQLGLRLAGGDIDDDGVDDLVVGAPYGNPTSSDDGSVYLFLGGSL